MASLKTLEKMVGGTGIEPVTPTMSRLVAMPKCMISHIESTSIFAECSRYTPVNRGQNRAFCGRKGGPND